MAKNLILNPSFEASLNNWATSGTVPTLTRTKTTGATSGQYSVRIVSPGLSAGQESTFSNPLVSILASTVYSARSVLTVNAVPANCFIYTTLNWYTAAFGFLSGNSSTNITAAGTTTATIVNITSPATAAWVNFQIGLHCNSGSGNVIDTYLDAIRLDTGSSAPNYADGNSPGWVWLGVNNDSQSAPGLSTTMMI